MTCYVNYTYIMLNYGMLLISYYIIHTAKRVVESAPRAGLLPGSLGKHAHIATFKSFNV